MSFETAIPFVIKHNAVIIQALVASILLLVAVLAVRNFLRSGDAGPAVGSANLEQLEGTLKKLLERAGQVPAVPANAEAAQLVSEIETLRASLAEKQELIEQMKLAPSPGGAAPVVAGESAPAGAASMSSDDKRALEDQIRDLQAKLAEYEIISEDIADLSFYKEENVKLQKQLEGLKGGAVAEAAPAAPAVGAAAPTPQPAPAADIDPAQAMVDSLMATPPEELAAAAPPAANATADEDLLKEFADAVSAQGGTPAPEEPNAEADAAAAALFDVERMTQEAGQLQKIAATVGDAPTGDALEAGLDADRLVAEAASMESIKPEDAKLMGDFEDFMKKGGA